jgi:hypothetical protein
MMQSMLMLRAFLERKNQDRLHTLEEERRKERDAVNVLREKTKVIYCQRVHRC